MISKWKNLLELNEWTINTKEIDPISVTYPDDCPEEDRYFVGIMPQEEALYATIFHDRKLTERDIIHELLHVKYPEWTEEQVNEVEGILYKLNKDEKDPKNKDEKDPNAIYDWGSFPLEKNFEWKNQNKDE